MFRALKKNTMSPVAMLPSSTVPRQRQPWSHWEDWEDWESKQTKQPCSHSGVDDR